MSVEHLGKPLSRENMKILQLRRHTRDHRLLLGLLLLGVGWLCKPQRNVTAQLA